MKYFPWIIICLLGLFLSVPFFASAATDTAPVPEAGEEEVKPPKASSSDKVTGSVSLGILSKYISRGYEYSRSSITIQPSVNIIYKGFSLTYWGNIDTKAKETPSYFPDNFNKTNKKWFNETDLTLSYGNTFGIATLTGGYISYNTKYAEETEELFLSVSLDIISKPTLAIYQDITSYPGTYINLSFAHSFDLYKEKSIMFDIGASFGYFAGKGHYWKTYSAATGDYTGRKYKGLHDGMVKAGFTIPITRAFVIQPTAQYWFPLSGNAKKKVSGVPYNPNGTVLNNFVWGITLAYNF